MKSYIEQETLIKCSRGTVYICLFYITWFHLSFTSRWEILNGTDEIDHDYTCSIPKSSGYNSSNTFSRKSDRQ